MNIVGHDPLKWASVCGAKGLRGASWASRGGRHVYRPRICPGGNAHQPVDPDVRELVKRHLRLPPIGGHRSQPEVGDGEPSASDVGPPVQMAVENFRIALEFAVLPAKASLSGLPMPNVGFTMCSK